MHVLILDDKVARQEAAAIGFMRAGFQVTATPSLSVAEACVCGGVLDLLIAVERLQGRLTHSLALLAEFHNPALSTVLITDRSGAETDELPELIPSVHSLVDGQATADSLVALGRSAADVALSFGRRRAPGRHRPDPSAGLVMFRHAA
jgi:hypothetical protein